MAIDLSQNSDEPQKPKPNPESEQLEPTSKDSKVTTIPGKLCRKMAVHPRKFLAASILLTIILSAIGVIVGEFNIEVDNKGWLSRKTIIADRQMQMDLVNYNRQKLFDDVDGVWESLRTTPYDIGFVDVSVKQEEYERRLELNNNDHGVMNGNNGYGNNSDGNGDHYMKQTQRSLIESAKNFNFKDQVMGSIQEKQQMANVNVNVNGNLHNHEHEHEHDQQRDLNDSGSCDTSWYEDYEQILTPDHLIAIWKVQPNIKNAASVTKSILDVDVLSEICKAEANTLQAMQDAELCNMCFDTNEQPRSCLPPHSITTLLRLKFDKMTATCDELMQDYEPIQEEFKSDLVACTKKYIDVFDRSSLIPGDTNGTCPVGFLPNLVDLSFGNNGDSQLRFTTSYFYTKATGTPQEIENFYASYKDMDMADGEIVVGVYDTNKETLSQWKVDLLVQSDMALAIASLTVTFIAMMIHTRSPWLTLLGILQIIFSIPMAYFVYTFVAGLDFFPFLNFIGVFVSAALGADDLFVAVDKFKNARIENPKGTTRDIAEVALPDAAGAMLLTTSTTAVAFFATCICRVPPILCFAVYCGLMIVFNYVLNIFFVFPGLCLYDIWLRRGSNNCFVSFCAKRYITTEQAHEMDLNSAANALEDPDHEDDEPKNTSLIHRMLSGYYEIIHKFRWFVLAVAIAATAFCIYYSFQIAQPELADVRLLPGADPFEKHFSWRSSMLSAILFSAGAKIEIAFGVKAGDTGPQNKPDILSILLLDDTFNPSTEEAQEYFKGYCDRLYATEFASPVFGDYKCAINLFDEWLAEQSESISPTTEYLAACDGAKALPVPEDTFDICITKWARLVGNRDVLSENNKVKIMTIGTQASIGFVSPIPTIRDEWDKYETFLKAEAANAPDGINKPIHVSFMWWWFDTNQQMFSTAMGAAAIAIAFSAVIVLFSSRSLLLVLFSEICIIYVLSAATATLVGFGWELGFLESVCFAILVGISCDFIIHFGHAYIHHEGSVDRGTRTKFAVVHMGPSILAAAATTLAAALVMLACTISFFIKFATILLVTILHATIGSFIIYIVLNDLFGPSEPTKLIDSLIAKITGGKKKEDEVDKKEIKDSASPDNYHSEEK